MSGIVKVPEEALRAALARKIAPKHATRLFQLRDIPGVMRSRLGWPVASALMERWFNGAPFRMPREMKFSESPYRLSQLPSAHLDDTTVTMQWALGFSRVRAAMDRLKTNWASPAAITLLKQRMVRQSSGGAQQCWRFGDLSKPARILDETCQVNYAVFGRWSDPLDDFYGAMGEAQIKVAVSGVVTPRGPGRAQVEVDELGFYLRDSYDSNDGNSFISQPLGCWGFEGMECGLRTSMDVPISDTVVDEEPSVVQGYKYVVQNAHFREWSEKNQKGGDFMVLSNVHRVRLPFPVKLEW